MPIQVACDCGGTFSAKDEHAGKRAKCPNCGKVLTIGGLAFDPDALERLQQEDLAGRARSSGPAEGEDFAEIKSLLAAILDALERPASGASPSVRRQYKVLTQKDKWFTQKFDPEKLEQALNAYADQGWVLKGVTTADIPGFGGNRNELVVVLER